MDRKGGQEQKAENWKSGLVFSLVVGVGGGEGKRQDLGMAIQARTREARNEGQISPFYDGNWSPREQLRVRGRVSLVQPELDSSEAVFRTPLGTSLPLLSAEAWGGGTSRRAQPSKNSRKTRLPMILGRKEVLGMCMWQEGGGSG